MNEYVWVLFLIGAGLSSWSAYLGIKMIRGLEAKTSQMAAKEMLLCTDRGCSKTLVSQTSQQNSWVISPLASALLRTRFSIPMQIVLMSVQTPKKTGSPLGSVGLVDSSTGSL